MSNSSETYGLLYFSPREHQHWRWSNGCCNELEWSGGPLIGFRHELQQILAELQPDGWPMLQSLLLIISACRHYWPEHRAWLESRGDSNVSSDELLRRLDRLYALPPEQRESPAAKVKLIRTIYEGQRPWLGPDYAEKALTFLEQIIPLRDAREIPQRDSPKHYPEEIQNLLKGLLRINAEAVTLRQQTGLEANVLPAPVDFPDDLLTYGSRFLAWFNDPQLSGVARIAHRLLSVITWPRSVGDSNELSMGGVSDLSNRGELDQLLLSELAYDDDTLAMRIALKEALYLRRECPAEMPPCQRRILLDAGLQMWGKSRVYGAAVALAFAAAEDTTEDLTVSVAVTDIDGWRPMDVSTRPGVLDLLSALSPLLHPGDELTDWSHQPVSARDFSELVVITAFETFNDTEFQSSLSRLPTRDYFMAFVDGTGRFELRRHTVHGVRTLITLELDLDELLKPVSEVKPLGLTNRSHYDIPAIMRMMPFPLRLTHNITACQQWPICRHGLISLASLNRLMYWDDPARAARQVGVALHLSGEIVAWHTPNDVWNREPSLINPMPPARTYAMLFNRQNKSWRLLSVNLEKGTTASFPLQAMASNCKHSVQGLIDNECAYLIGDQLIEAFSLVDGSRLASRRVTSPLKFHGNSYVMQNSLYYRMQFIGKEIEFSKCDYSQPIPADVVLLDASLSDDQNALVNCLWLPIRGPGGFWSSYERGVSLFPKLEFVATSVQQVFQRGSLIAVRGHFTQFGRVQTRDESQRTIVCDLAAVDPRWEQSLDTTPNWPDFVMQLFHLQLVRRRGKLRAPLRHKFSSIVVAGQKVFLISSSGTWWQLTIADNRLKLVMSPEKGNVLGTYSAHALDPADLGKTLQKTFRDAKLENGNRVRLDKCGLLHLIPVDTSLPEMTLVLDERNLSGWIADGRTWGDTYYVSSDQLPPHQVWRELLAPFFGVAS